MRAVRIIVLLSLSTCFVACEGGSNLQVIDADNITYTNDEASGSVSGTVLNKVSGEPVPGVNIVVLAKGQVTRSLSESDGNFTIDIDKTLRGEGYNIHFQKRGFQNATRPAVFKLASHRVMLGDVEIIPQGAVN